MIANRIKPGRISLLVAFSLSVASTAAFAHSPDQERLCTSDAMRLCSSQIPNIDQVTACMRKQKANLSDACKAVFDK